MSSTQSSPTCVDVANDATDFFLPYRPWNKSHNRLFILPPSSVLKPNPALSSWCSAPQSPQWWLKKRISISLSMCVSQPDPCPVKVPIIVVPKWVCLVLYSIFWCDWVEGWRTKMNGEKWCTMNGEKWWWRGPLLLLGVKGLELIKAVGGV